MLEPRRLFAGAALAAVVMLTATACASRGALYRYPAGVRTVDDRAYTIGYEEGFDRGRDDAERRRGFDYQRHGDYRDGDEGYRGGNRNAYRSLYRQGFVAGYDDGYRRYARGSYAVPRPPYGRGGYRYPRAGGPPVRYISPAAENGYRDGFEAGRDDARDGDRFDPIRTSRYRSGDRGYNSRYGSRDDYKRDYRAVFQRGYSDGYTQNRRR